jgi:hypothetical protein
MVNNPLKPRQGLSRVDVQEHKPQHHTISKRLDSF